MLNAETFVAFGFILFVGLLAYLGVHKTLNAALDKRAEARMKGFEGDACGSCGNFTLVRNGTCLKCNTCGGTSGCS